MIDTEDLRHLRRCLELAAEALDAGDEPFGSVLVGPDGTVLGVPKGPVLALPINEVAPDLVVNGPADELTDQVRALHARHHRVTGVG